MKNMKKLLQKAMVFTLSAAMLVGTPMTASAAGLVDLYSISDGTGTVDENDNPTTGTITNTDTNTGFLIENNKVSIVGIALDRETVNTEVGTQEILKATVVLDGKVTAAEDIYRYDEDGKKTDELICKAGDITDLVVAEMSKKIEWKLLYTDKDGNIIPKMPNPADKVGIVLTAGSASDRSQVTLTPRAGTKDGEEVTVRASIDASYYYQQSDDKQNTNKLQLEKEGSREGTYYTADAKVSVKEYTNELKWSDNKTSDELTLKHTLDLGAKLARDPETANDAITWASSNTKVATVSATGVVTAKKAGTETAPATADITAVSERGKVATRTITVVQGQKADEVVIYIDGVETKGTVPKNLSSDSASKQMKNVTAEMYVKVKKAYTKDGVVVDPTDKSGAVIENIDGTLTNNVRVKSEQWYIDAEGKAQKAPKITDTITWSSNKAAVATVDNKGVVTLKAVGTAAITAKATNGKSAKINVKVTADLNKLTIKNNLKKAYSGQTIQMDLERDPAENKDAVKWTVTKKDGTVTKSATINAKGVLTIKNQVVDRDDEIIVKVETTKAVKPDQNGVKQKVSTQTEAIKLEQSSIDGITVVEGTNTTAAPIAKVGLEDGKIKQLVKAGTSNINVPLTKTYTAKVDGDGADLGATLLTWKTNKPKVVSISGSGKSAKITALAPGKATITVSGVRSVKDSKGNAKASVIKTTFTVQVKQPVTTLTMNKPTVTMAEKYKKVGKEMVGGQNQNVTLQVAFGPKNADKSQKEIDSWTVQKVGEDPITLKIEKGKNAGKNITTAKVTYTMKGAKAGDVYKITAKSITGATATSTVTIVAPTTKVQILDKGNNDAAFPKAGAQTVVGKPLSIKAQVQVDGVWLDAGSDKAKEAYAEDVTYTVNKKGIITVDKDGNVYPIKKGTVTITAKTPTGKKATLKVNVN